MYDLLGNLDKWIGARCTEKWVNPEIFFDRWAIEEAQMICEKCPLMQQCAEYALENNITEGVWGGLSETQRKETWKKARGKRSRKGIPNRKLWD